jgi:hypothetical protein
MPSPSQSANARARVASQMDSTVVVRRKAGETRNPETGTITPTWVTVYEGPGRIRESTSQPRDVDAAGQRLAEQRPVVSMPIGTDSRIVTGSSAAVAVNDVGEVLTNPNDPSIVGVRFRIAGTHDQTFSTARRLPVEVYSHG